MSDEYHDVFHDHGQASNFPEMIVGPGADWADAPPLDPSEVAAIYADPDLRAEFGLSDSDDQEDRDSYAERMIGVIRRLLRWDGDGADVIETKLASLRTAREIAADELIQELKVTAEVVRRS